MTNSKTGLTRFQETQAEDYASIVADEIISRWSDDWCEGCTRRICPEDYHDDKCPRHDHAEHINEAVTEFMYIMRKACTR